MTKEEILNKHDSSRKYIEQTCRPELFAAMDEYAKQQSMAFSEWAFKDDNPFVEGANGRWIQECGNSTSWSTEELYAMFIKQQTENK